MRNKLKISWMWGLLLPLWFVLQGCHSSKVYSDYVEGIDFSQFKTFAWLPSHDTSKSLYDNKMVMNNMRNEINNQMELRGYSVDTKNPDVLLLLHANFEDRQELVRTPIYSTYSYYYPGFYAGPGYPFYYNYYNTIPNVVGYDIRPVEFTQGTIVIDMIRSSTNELIWRGWTKTEIDNPEKFKKDVDKAVDDIFKKFPVAKKKK